MGGGGSQAQLLAEKEPGSPRFSKGNATSVCHYQTFLKADLDLRKSCSDTYAERHPMKSWSTVSG